MLLNIIFRINFNRKKENVNAHNYSQWIGVEKDLSVIKPHSIHFVNNFDMF